MSTDIQLEKIPWNKGRLTGQKKALKLPEILKVRFHLELKPSARELAMFNLAIDSKLRGCDLVKLRVSDVMHGGRVSKRATVIQQKTGKPVTFEIATEARKSLTLWIEEAQLVFHDFLFQSRTKHSDHISTRQYARIVNGWIKSIGLDPEDYGTHSLRRTKASLIYTRTHNLRAVQLLLGPAQSSVRGRNDHALPSSLHGQR